MNFKLGLYSLNEFHGYLRLHRMVPSKRPSPSVQSNHLPLSVAFQIVFTFKNMIIHRCIVDEGDYSCVMSSVVWKKLGSPELVPSPTTLQLHARAFESQGILPNPPIEIASKTIIVNVEGIHAPLGYNMLLQLNYMYSMKMDGLV